MNIITNRQPQHLPSTNGKINASTLQSQVTTLPQTRIHFYTYSVVIHQSIRGTSNSRAASKSRGELGVNKLLSVLVSTLGHGCVVAQTLSLACAKPLVGGVSPIKNGFPRIFFLTRTFRQQSFGNFDCFFWVAIRPTLIRRGSGMANSQVLAKVVNSKPVKTAALSLISSSGMP